MDLQADLNNQLNISENLMCSADVHVEHGTDGKLKVSLIIIMES